ncbi:uncharacterized protein LOC106164033 [Lingula anatina]|uniref:Uncharacterized protein LOC106164033 n=1 Tax=Lingula anatina TaxID=7574 RepID=A0A1S3IH92_LINAN|nr:uncharacterized protein LOC106164033 [Lingula anatina]|eukprot:XP_013397241.1 uncharacterized protein LOC106164033 [Lingula anatina]
MAPERDSNMKWILCVTAALVLVAGKGDAIDCFSCVSANGSDIGCHDPFNPALSRVEKACRQGMENRYGLFPASYCIKIKGEGAVSKKQIYVRTCAIDTMENQCGEFQFEGVLYKGCITTCKTDSCNTAPRTTPFWSSLLVTVIVVLVLLRVR